MSATPRSLHSGTCAATGKRTYKRHQDAAKAVAHAAKNPDQLCSDIPIAFYKCRACGRWHLTSKRYD